MYSTLVARQSKILSNLFSWQPINSLKNSNRFKIYISILITVPKFNKVNEPNKKY